MTKLPDRDELLEIARRKTECLETLNEERPGTLHVGIIDDEGLEHIEVADNRQVFSDKVDVLLIRTRLKGERNAVVFAVSIPVGTAEAIKAPGSDRKGAAEFLKSVSNFTLLS
jgi:hypothetical protein